MLTKLNVPANSEEGTMVAMMVELVEVVRRNGSQIPARHFTCPIPAR